MLRYLYIFISVVLLPILLSAHDRKHKPWWPVKPDGTMKYVYIGELREGRRVVIDAQDRYGFIDSALNDRIPCIYDSATPFINSKALVKKNGKYGIVDTAGNELVPVQFDSIGAAKLSDRYYDPLKIIDSVALIKENGKIGLYNINNRRLRWIDYDLYSETYWDHLNIRVVSRDGKLALISADGEVLTPFVYTRIERGPLNRRLVKRDGLWGFLDSNCKEAIPCQYTAALAFSNDLAAVKQRDCWGFINYAGNMVAPTIYQDVFPFTEGRAAVKLDGKWGFIDTNGHCVTEICYDKVHRFNNGQAEVRYQGKWCLIDQTGNRITAWYDTIIDHSDNYRKYRCTIVKQNGKYGTINSAGAAAIPCIYDSINYWSYIDHMYLGGLLPFMDHKGKIALVDTSGLQRTTFRYDNARPVYGTNGSYYYEVSINNNKGFIGSANDTTGVIFDEVDNYPQQNGKQYFPVRIDSNWGILAINPLRLAEPVNYEDKNTAILHYEISEKQRTAVAAGIKGYVWVNEFHHGLARVQNAAGLSGYINKHGKEVIPCRYITPGEFYNKWAVVDSGNLNSLINRKGSVIFPWRKEIMVWYSRFGVLRKGEKFGLFNRHGKVTLPCEYEEWGRIWRNAFVIGKDGKYGLVNRKGKIIVPLAYDGFVRQQHKYACLTKGEWSEENNKQQDFIFNSRGKRLAAVDSSLSVTSLYNNGRIAVKDTNGKYGYINKRGKLVIPCIYSSAEFFYNHGAVVELKDTLHPYDDATGIINKRGKVLMPFKYSYLSTWARHTPMTVKINKYNGYATIDSKGHIKTPFVYTQWVIQTTTGMESPKRHFKREGNEWLYRNHRGKIKFKLPAADDLKID